MQRSIQGTATLHGTLRLPGDKSISHRAAIFNAIADGEAQLNNMQRGSDVTATLDCLTKLGVSHNWIDKNTLHIAGTGRSGLHEPPDALDTCNSGTTIRLLAGLLAPQPFNSILSGDASLRSRPMDRIISPLSLMGADIQARDGNNRAPLVINGHPLEGIHYRLPVASAQVKSALILATLFAKGKTLLETDPSRDHTERMLKAMGADVHTSSGGIEITPLTKDLSPLNITIPADISAASFWLAAATIHPKAEICLERVGVNHSRSGIIDVLREMGADITLTNKQSAGPEPVADLIVRSSPRLKGVVIGGESISRIIDELPLLALVGSLAEGETVIRNATELRVKESDRISVTTKELRRLGAEITELPDGMHIRGVKELRGTSVSSHGDHRLAMTLAVAGLLAKGETIIHNSQAVAVSYTEFWRDLELVTTGQPSF